MSTEIADAYVALYTKMPGVKGDITKALGGSDVQGAIKSSGGKSGSSFMGGLGNVVRGGAIAVGVAAAAGLGTALVKGFQRLESLDQATAKLDGLGHSAESVESIMTNALASVRGTAFGMADAATVAASVVAAGVKPGQDLERTLKLVADAATIAGTDMGSMGQIFNKVATTGKLQGEVIQQLGERGIPILQLVAAELGITAGEVSTLASQGKIDFATFQAAMESGLGGAALSSGNTFSGAMANVMASLGRIGAGLLDGIFPYLAPLMQAITTALGPLEELAVGFGDKIGSVVGPALQGLTDLLNSGFDASGFFDLLSVLSPIGLAFKVLEPLLPTLLDSFMQIGTVLGGALSGALDALLPIFTQFAELFASNLATLLPVIVPIISMLAEVFAQVLAAVLPLVATLVSALMPVFEAIAPIIAALLPIFAQIIGLLVPIISAIFPVLASLVEALAPIVVMLVDAFLKLLTPILELISPLLDLVGMILPPLIELIGFVAGIVADQLVNAFGFLLPIIEGVVGYISSSLIPIIETIVAVLGGLITFLTGVFTGDWEKAWQGIQDIFSGLWEGIQSIAKGALNGIIELINGVIGGLNSLAGGVSEMTGGAINLSIPKIPKLAMGAIITARPGGVLANIGEGRYDEVVQPLGGPQFDGLADALAKKMGSSGASYTAINPDPQTVVELMMQRMDQKARTA